MQQYLSNQRELYFAGKLNKEEVEANLGRYINSIKNQPKNRVVVLEDVIASGAEKLNP
jgi:orotate phosphoribosyltransferase